MKTSGTPEVAGDPETVLRARLSLIERSLREDPAFAEARAAELLAAFPGHPMAVLFRGIARRLMGDPAAAIEVLAPLCRDLGDAPLPHLQLGLALRESGDTDAAIRAIRRAVSIKPDFSDAWLALADLLTVTADSQGADQAFGRYIEHSMHDPRLLEPATLLRDNRTAEAGKLLRKQLERHPTDVCALLMLADVAARTERTDDAEALLRRCLDLAPGYRLARHNYAVVLMREEKQAEALHEVEALLAEEPANADLLNLKAAILLRLGEYERATSVFEDILRAHPEEPGAWASLGHALRTVGRREQSIDAYRKATAVAPDFGEAAWNLANLKTYRITDRELESMRRQLQRTELRHEDRVHFNFAIGKALEDRRLFDESFRHYAEGNRLRRERLPYDAEEMSAYVRRCIEMFTPAFFAERAGCGASSPDPVFIVGLPRSGSTLVEQMLASHSAVEGTMELHHITDIAKRLARKGKGAGYPGVLMTLEPHDFRELGELYLERAGHQRKSGKPFFIDKMPNNFAHIGLLELIVPNARIVDVRRNPMASGLSLFTHHFASGQPFSYSLEDIGRYYRDYVDLMAHFDTTLPGRVHRVEYETLVDDTGNVVRRLLEYCGLPFEQSCLKYFDNSRPVSTPSSEQVRTPIFRDALEHWRNFEPWLVPLQDALRSPDR